MAYLTVQLICDDMNDIVLDNIIRSKIYDYSIKIYTKFACPALPLSFIRSIFLKHLLVFAILLLVAGLWLTFLGVKFYRTSLIVIGMLSFYIGHIFAIDALSFDVFSLFLITVISSILTGYFLTKFPTIGLFMLGGWVGLIFSLLLNNLFIYHISSNAIPFTIVSIVLSVTLGILALFVPKTFVVFATSFIGSYFVLRAFSWYVGNFPN